MAKMICVLLVGGFNPSEEYEFVSWDDYAQYGKIRHVPNHQTVCKWGCPYVTTFVTSKSMVFFGLRKVQCWLPKARPFLSNPNWGIADGLPTLTQH